MNKKWMILLGFFLLLVSFWFISNTPYFTSQSEIVVGRLFDLDKCIKGGQIPCRWAQNLGGFGYPLFNYVGPLPYYTGEIFYLLSNSLTFAVKIMLLIPLFGSLFFVYIFVRIFFNKKTSVLVALFYSFIVYFGLILYNKDILSLLWVLIFIPAVLWAIFRLQTRLGISSVLFLVVLSVFLILSDYSGFVIFLPGFILLILFLFLQKRDFRFLKLAVFSIGLGLLLSSFYWVPLIMEKDFANLNGMISDRPKNSLEISRYEILTGDTKILDYQERVGWITFQAETKSHSIIRLAQYYFPDWIIEVDGKAVEINYKDSLGLMTFILGEGRHNIEAKLYDTPVRTLANLLSLSGLLLLTLLFIAQFRKIRQWIFYYVKSLYR